MRAAIIDEPGAIRVGEVADPTPGATDVVVKVGACGICGTDLHIADGEFPPAPFPLVPGHEFAGEVVEVGSDVRTGISVGDRVAVDPSLFCGYCTPCRTGRGNLCANWGATGDTVDGAFAEYVAVPAVTAYRLPDSLSMGQGALVEPLSCAVHGLDVFGASIGERILVVGAGTMGLLLTQLLVGSGARVSVVDRNAARLPLATQFGAEHVATSVAELDAAPFDAAVDVTGAPKAIEDAFDSLRRGGRLQIFGVAADTARISLSPFRIYNDEIRIVGSMAVLDSFEPALRLLETGQVDTTGLISHTLPLEEFPEAVAMVRAGTGVKVQIAP
ncbi:zinc-dependent alcohol dehydrogenase family protein [Actinoalloteichus hymeniacidonis]|uniref:Zn-dependent alcohol dehydrogenase n=1 Tax=Actinoalloteichus hymeniacidonis TaxID=340345 RepID=A0AAC9HSI0_9PSEU|nr:zinc-dependent alcohol dehydrogenase family protein [Actinoalloteichus hymeniacidonis]AOS64774.1 Zn-dependent alcohol dehydrogenase [Actinoalloteichus hymeniacidonis]MBB5907150.1 2-desacetyl-2-hydroxyethyl bacteriochlorophyllide A dehydrogenase [Actinoalloteichus hymeniacidonis]